jgi:DNA-binding CsgD family transcriptional regulator
MLADASMNGPFSMADSRRNAAVALELAAELGRQDLEVAAQALLARLDIVEGKLRPSIAQYEKAYSQAKSWPELRQHRTFLYLPLALYSSGRIEEAIKHGQEVLDSARTAQDLNNTVVASGNLGLALTGGGRYIEALQSFALAREAARQLGGAGVLNGLSRAVGMSAAVYMATFNFDLAEEVAEEARDLGNSINFLLPVVSESLDLMRIAIHRDKLASADALALQVEEKLDSGGIAHGLLWRIRLAEARAELALARNNWQETVESANKAMELARSMGRPKYEVLALTARGSALAGLGRKREGIAEMRQAIEVARLTGDPATFLSASAALLTLEGDDALAAEALRASERMLANLPENMRAPLEAAEAVQLVRRMAGPRSGRPPPQRPAYPDGLSEREVEVLRLIARGRSNPQIALELVISVNTVQRHVSNILAKAGLVNRAEAASYAQRRGLGPE